MHVCPLKQEGDKLIRLWVHEVYRVFSDRLIEDKDKEAFFNIVKERTRTFFQKSMDEVNASNNNYSRILLRQIICSPVIRNNKSEAYDLIWL